MKPEDVKKEQELNEEELEGATGGKVETDPKYNTLIDDLDPNAQAFDPTTK